MGATGPGLCPLECKRQEEYIVTVCVCFPGMAAGCGVLLTGVGVPLAGSAWCQQFLMGRGLPIQSEGKRFIGFSLF